MGWKLLQLKIKDNPMKRIITVKVNLTVNVYLEPTKFYKENKNRLHSG